MSDSIRNGIAKAIANGIGHGMRQGMSHALGDESSTPLPPTPLFPSPFSHQLNLVTSVTVSGSLAMDGGYAAEFGGVSCP